MSYPSPCEKCPKDGTKHCNYEHCRPWLIRYRYRQRQINAYAEKVLPAYLAKQNAQAEKCVCCGEIIPEGRQVCPACEGGAKDG